MLTGLGVPLDVEIKVAVFQVEDCMRPRPGESGKQQNRCRLGSVALVREDVDIGSPVVLENLHKVIGF